MKDKMNQVFELIIEQNEDVIKNLREKKGEIAEIYTRGFINGVNMVLTDIKTALRILNKDGGENGGCNL